MKVAARNLAVVLVTALMMAPGAAAVGTPLPFAGEKTTWLGQQPSKRSGAQPRDYRFDGTMSRAVLDNYLSRSISMEGLLNGRGDLDDNIRMLKATGAKFVGRSLCLWTGEANLLRNLKRAREQLPKVHAADPDMILQACIFESVSTQVEQVPVPDWAFKALGQPVEKRNFRYADMLYLDGGRRKRWGRNSSVPDVSRPETKLWFYFLAVSYIDLGFEAIHFGQAEIMNRNDRDHKHWSEVLTLVRAYAAMRARRRMVLCDAHTPSGGLVRDGKLLFDFHSFPLRVMEVPDKPQEAVLKVGFSDGIYGRSKGGLTPSGWKCDHLPYLVELDNWGASRKPGQPKAGGIWVWGYDEITWFAHQGKEYRAGWLRYAWDWVRNTDPNGFLQMPGSRTMRSPLDGRRWYHANTPSLAVPGGQGDEDAIRAIWAAASDPPASAEVTAAMQPYFDRYKLAGVIGIIADRNGKIHYKNLLGFADVEAKKPISEDNVFWIASMTKMFAGASIMMLVDEGKVSLDDPVTKFIPQLKKWMVIEEKDPFHVLLKPPVRPVTLRHVLSHTSGLAGMSELQQVTGADSTPLKARALSSVTGPLQWQPGDKYAYGNQGMNIAARVVEIVSGMPYEEFLQKRFFNPLGMTETTFWPSEGQVARLAGAYGPNKKKNGYARGNIGFLTKPLNDRIHRYPEAGGGLFSTTHDILRFGLMLANDGKLDGKRYLSHAAMEELRKEQTGKTRVNYSLGYHLRNGMFGHDGAYGTDLSVNPKTGMVAIFMVQCTSGDQWAARDLFLDKATRIFPK